MKYNITIPYPNFFFLPTQVSRFTVLRSPHIHKKSREQFEYRLYNSIFNFALPLNTAHAFSLVDFRFLFKNVLEFRGLTNKLTSRDHYYYIKRFN